MENVSYKEYLVRLAAIRAEWESPSRTDQYLMALRHEVRYHGAKNIPAFNSSDYKLLFADKTVTLTPPQDQEGWKRDKANLIAIAQGNYEIMRRAREQNIEPAMPK